MTGEREGWLSTGGPPCTASYSDAEAVVRCALPSGHAADHWPGGDPCLRAPGRYVLWVEDADTAER